MAKDPAFLFYPNDWIGGTMGMTFEEKGAYMELLMMQFNRGHMTEHMIGQTVGQLWLKIEDKFTQDADGLWYNERLEEEQKKRKKYSESRRNNKSGKNQYTKKKEEVSHISGHMTEHMIGHMVNVNVNENISIDNSKKKLFKIPEIDQVCDYFFSKGLNKDQANEEANKFHDFYTSKGWMIGKNKMKDWEAAVRNWIKKVKVENNRQQIHENDFKLNFEN